MKTGAFLLAGFVGVALVATPASGQNPLSWKFPERAPPVPFNGEACQVSGEVTACPKLGADSRLEHSFSDLLHDRHERDVTVSYCIKANGRIDETVVVSDTSGNDGPYDSLLRTMGFMRFHPGKINGKPARMCGFTSLLQFRPRKWSEGY